MQRELPFRFQQIDALHAGDLFEHHFMTDVLGQMLERTDIPLWCSRFGDAVIVRSLGPQLHGPYGQQAIDRRHLLVDSRWIDSFAASVAVGTVEILSAGEALAGEVGDRGTNMLRQFVCTRATGFGIETFHQTVVQGYGPPLGIAAYSIQHGTALAALARVAGHHVAMGWQHVASCVPVDVIHGDLAQRCPSRGLQFVEHSGIGCPLFVFGKRRKLAGGSGYGAGLYRVGGPRSTS
ncbi:hypothetical protein BC427_04615 [Ralstonia solanacearum FJAT-91]|nr:hypothetical protein BC427_04615 [Ralstonia solanacearum FJAT-91]